MNYLLPGEKAGEGILHEALQIRQVFGVLSSKEQVYPIIAYLKYCFASSSNMTLYFLARSMAIRLTRADNDHLKDSGRVGFALRRMPGIRR